MRPHALFPGFVLVIWLYEYWKKHHSVSFSVVDSKLQKCTEFRLKGGMFILIYNLISA